MIGLRCVLPLLLALPATAAAHQERLVHSADASAGCVLRLEADDEARTLRLRVSPEGKRCRVSQEAVQRFLAAAFAKVDPPPPGGPYRSLFLGRLVDYPWLAVHLATTAAADGRWDRRRGKPRSLETSTYVAALLSAREVTVSLEAPVAAGGYRLGPASVEKVLVGELTKMPDFDGPRLPGKLPFDAMTWFRLERVPTNDR